MSELKRGLRSTLAENENASEGSTDGVANRTGAENGTANGSGSSELSKRARRRMRRDRTKRLTLSVLPTLLTLGNGVCGLAAISVAMSINLEWTLETKMMVAGLLIFGGMLFDALDGSAARMTGQESEFGGQLDSLCDAITFGTAPAVLVWRFNSGGFLPTKLTWAIGVLFALCVLIRLARFNVETDEDDTHEGFEGLPSPAAAGTIAAFAIAMHELASYLPSPTSIDAIDAGASNGLAANAETAAAAGAVVMEESRWPNVEWLAESALNGLHYLIPALALVLAFLMVSRFQYPHIISQLVRGKRTPHQIGQALFVLIGALLFHWLVLPIAFCYYAFRAPIESLLARAKKGSRTAKPAGAE